REETLLGKNATRDFFACFRTSKLPLRDSESKDRGPSEVNGASEEPERHQGGRCSPKMNLRKLAIAKRDHEKQTLIEQLAMDYQGKASAEGLSAKAYIDKEEVDALNPNKVPFDFELARLSIRGRRNYFRAVRRLFTCAWPDYSEGVSCPAVPAG
ncbi:unnamed protein product, partial [Amoebophrya sp. A25]